MPIINTPLTFSYYDSYISICSVLAAVSQVHPSLPIALCKLAFLTNDIAHHLQAR